MDQVPKEIQKQILNYLEDKTKRIARVTCKQWFDFIDYRNFTLYSTKKSDWPQIADRLSSYSKPISLRFAKSIMNKLRDFNEHLLRLTSLTDLTFAQPGLDESEENLEAEWFKLTSLPNLHSIEVKNGDYTVPVEAILSFPNITKYEHSWPDSEDNTLVEEAFRRWTNLESCWITPNNSKELDLFDTYNTKVTNLYVRLPNAPGKWLNQLGNIKDLSIGTDTNCSLKSFTALESLLFMGELQINELNSTKLTFLETLYFEEKHVEQFPEKLATIKELEFEYKVDDDNEDENDRQPRFSNQWLTALTNLEGLCISPMEGDGLDYISTKLTRLQMYVHPERQVDLRHVSRFISLKELILASTDALQYDLSLLSVLTTLEDLHIRLQDSTSETNFLSSMTNLKCLGLARFSIDKLPHLPNLQELAISLSTDCQVDALERLSKLTHLSMDIGDADYTFISNLTTLQYLWLDRNRKYDCTYFSTLTALHFLRFYEVTSEDDYSYLSTLTKLTELKISAGPPSGKILHFPTSLQRLEVGFPSEENEAIIDPLKARLPNLYGLAFHAN